MHYIWANTMSEREGTLDMSHGSNHTFKVTKLIKNRVRVKPKFPVFQTDFSLDDIRRYLHIIITSYQSNSQPSPKLWVADSPPMEVRMGKEEEVTI